jgi:hypothetical protein
MNSPKWYNKKGTEVFLKFDEEHNQLCIVDKNGLDRWYLFQLQQNPDTSLYEMHIIPFVDRGEAAAVGIATDEKGAIIVHYDKP